MRSSTSRSAGRPRSPRRRRAAPSTTASRCRRRGAARRSRSRCRRNRLRRCRRAAGRAGGRRGCRRTSGTRGSGAGPRRARRSRDARPGAAATIEPIGSSTSGIQMSSRVPIDGSVHDPLRDPPGDLCRGDEQEHAEQAPEHVRPDSDSATSDAALDAGDRGDADPGGDAEVDVAVPPLPPRSDDRRRQDREERGRLRVELRQAEDERERRHEQDPAADAEEPGQHAAQAADRDHERRSSYEEPHADGGQQQREEVATAAGPGSAAGTPSRRARRASQGGRRAARRRASPRRGART